MLGALPKQTWVRQLQPRGQDLLAILGHPVEGKSPAPHRRWQWPWVGDESVFKPSGQPRGLVGTWDRGQDHRVRRGIDGLLGVVVGGEGTRGMPVDGTVRRPDPRGPGRPCRATRRWWPGMLDRTWAAIPRRGRQLPAPLVVADRGFGDSKILTHVALYQGGTLLGEGQRPDVFQLHDGRQVSGRELRSRSDWPWRDSPQVPPRRSGRLTAPSPTYGQVTVVIVDDPSPGRYALRWPATPVTAPRLIRAWTRRSWMAHPCRLLKPLVATEACQVHGADA
jgi:hypothetical protein